MEGRHQEDLRMPTACTASGSKLSSTLTMSPSLWGCGWSCILRVRCRRSGRWPQFLRNKLLVFLNVIVTEKQTKERNFLNDRPPVWNMASVTQSNPCPRPGCKLIAAASSSILELNCEVTWLFEIETCRTNRSIWGMEQPEDFKKIQKYYSNLYCGCRLNFYSFFMLIIDRTFNSSRYLKKRWIVIVVFAHYIRCLLAD